MKPLFLVLVFKNEKLSKQFVTRTPDKWEEKYMNDKVYSCSISPILELNLM